MEEEEQVRRCRLERRKKKGGPERGWQAKGEEMGFKYKSRHRAHTPLN